MAERPLSPDELALGRAILLATDSMGMGAEGAFWFFDPDTNEWLFFLSTSLIGKMNMHQIYLRLIEGLKRKISDREMRAFMIYLAHPDDDLSTAVRKAKLTTQTATEPVALSIQLRDSTRGAVVYRMAETLPARRRHAARERFRKRYREVIAAA